MTETPKEFDVLITKLREIMIERKIGSGDDGYINSANAVLDAIVATFEAGGSIMGLSGFQAGWVALSALGKMNRIEGPYAFFQARDMVYPQHDLRRQLEEWIAKSMPWVADQARKLLAKNPEHAAAHVVAHWRNLAMLPGEKDKP